MIVTEDKGAAHRNIIKLLKFNPLTNKFLEKTNDIHLGLKLECCNAENRALYLAQ